VSFQPKDDLPIIALDSAKDWEKWLTKNHGKSAGVWLKLTKKKLDKLAMTHAEALEVALCYGWIDGQARSYDESSWLQRFTRRRPKSGWSKINTQHAERLIKARRMKAAGLKEIKAAKTDGRWAIAYDPPSASTIPDDFLKLLSQNKKAKAFFETLNKTNLYSISYRLQTAKKPETRAKRMKVILEMLARGEKFH
jgi:uncharacterized protein YdeI (YjbR/CyaY-like superfamily)